MLRIKCILVAIFAMAIMLGAQNSYADSSQTGIYIAPKFTWLHGAGYFKTSESRSVAQRANGATHQQANGARVARGDGARISRLMAPQNQQVNG
ncbi:MAG: hypothetical protein LBR22_04225, partial [Desulfovibrio sp.]|nr:hypothetical protein [Desulfovibrio sp.]